MLDEQRSSQVPPEHRPPYSIDNARMIYPGTEAGRILNVTSTTADEEKRVVRKIVKEVDPINFILPDDVRIEANQKRRYPSRRALYIARYKKEEYKNLREALGDQIVHTEHVVMTVMGEIKIGIFQDPIAGETAEQIVKSGPVPQRVLDALDIYLNTLRVAKANPKYAQNRALAGKIPTANELITGLGFYNRHDPQAEICKPSNIVYDEPNNRFVAIDW